MGQNYILNLNKQLNNTKLSRMTYLGFKEPRIIGVLGGVVGINSRIWRSIGYFVRCGGG